MSFVQEYTDLFPSEYKSVYSFAKTDEIISLYELYEQWLDLQRPWYFPVREKKWTCYLRVIFIILPNLFQNM